MEQMLGDEAMLEEVKSRLKPKLEVRVRAALERELEEGVEMMRR